ncbi:MAG: hypothetical protein H6558_22255 [Lewinellaceae bacterium]|nr:hypothetical protein [Lewinellaceae bacterium]
MRRERANIILNKASRKEHSPDTDKLRELDDSQKLLFQRLKEWRKEVAAKEGLPASNASLATLA